VVLSQGFRRNPEQIPTGADIGTRLVDLTEWRPDVGHFRMMDSGSFGYRGHDKAPFCRLQTAAFEAPIAIIASCSSARRMAPGRTARHTPQSRSW
jgi:hypothetical protein